jgi:peptidoglycan pentaglycine glycine transferase (the first glycine)
MNKDLDSKTWNEQTASLPGAHILQSWEWGQFKKGFGWEPIYRTWQDETGRTSAAALILQRSISLGGFAPRLNVLYVPRGPVLDWSDSCLREMVLDDLQAFAKKQGAIFLKIDPEIILGTGIPGTENALETPVGQAVMANLNERGWRFSQDQIQFRNTVWLDITPSEEVWLARMKQKARYNLRLAQKKGVVVREGTLADLPPLYRMYAETSVRDGFVIRSEAYYLTLWRMFMEQGMAKILIAEVEGEAVGAVVLFLYAGKAWYLFGMSREAHREKMPNYLLQWEAMRSAKAAGCTRYDLWGAPDEFTEEDAMWGVFRFKEGLGGDVMRTPGAWDYTSQPWLYKLYTSTLPRILDVMRRKGKEATKQRVSV